MLQFKNKTPFAGTIMLCPDPVGIDSLYALVKGTFSLGGTGLVRAAEQLPVVLADQYRGEPGKSSIKTPSDTALIKPGTDVLLIGSACAPGGRAVSELLVSLSVGPIRKIVRVLGDRVWEGGAMGGAKVSTPVPFQVMPLTWERAFGGLDQTPDKPPKLAGEPRNPVGTGFRIDNGIKPLSGMKLPNLEAPTEPITRWNVRPAPVGFGPTCPHWEPRKRYAGTYDENWQKSRAPYLPRDFDPRFFQIAPEDQIVPGYLKGGETVQITNVTPSGSLRLELPRTGVIIDYGVSGRHERRPANLDTVIIEPDQQRVVLIWRATLQCDKKALEIREVEAALAA